MCASTNNQMEMWIFGVPVMEIGVFDLLNTARRRRADEHDVRLHSDDFQYNNVVAVAAEPKGVVANRTV